jgi:hypothetical protein
MSYTSKEGDINATPIGKGTTRKIADRSPDSEFESPDPKRPHDDLKRELSRLFTDKFEDLRRELRVDNDELRKQIADLRNEISTKNQLLQTLEGNLDSALNQLNEVQTALAQKDEKIDSLGSAIEDSEQYSRRTSVRISGLGPFQGDTDFKAVALDVAADMECDVTINDIDRAHPVGREGKQLIVKFMSYTARSKFLKNRKKLRDKRKKVYVNEDLTFRRYSMFKRLLDLRKKNVIESTWTRDGRLFVFRNGQKQLIKTDMDIDRLSE